MISIEKKRDVRYYDLVGSSIEGFFGHCYPLRKNKTEKKGSCPPTALGVSGEEIGRAHV